MGLKDGISPTPTYLEFSNAQEFADYLVNPGKFDTPQDFVPLSTIISEKKDAFFESMDPEIIKNYFSFKNGRLNLEYNYFGLSNALNKDQLVSIGGQMIKFDFDGQKISLKNSIEDLLTDQNVTTLEAETFRIPVRNIETRSPCVAVYAEFTDVFGLYVGAICAQVIYPGSGHEMESGSFTANGGWVGVDLSNKTDFGSQSEYVSDTQLWSKGLASYEPDCSDTLLKIKFDNGRFQTAVVHTSAPLDPVCSVDFNLTTLSESIDPCP
ncbi:hypothetical protein [Membranihabitans maritimus]|uniref:hypothetical protein n=1 Tax=Membranihabitans maritimus TaxID=2904244 RepID=UPI001F489036|nr:hypothetical protein [Membranihabitans maritimus]